MRNNLIPCAQSGVPAIPTARFLSRNACCLVLLLLLGFSAGNAQAQTVSHPASGITTTASYFFYTHFLSATEKKDLKYIIVRASNGDIKTMFNACDVCYYAYKGYSQIRGEMRCNNCGTRFLIDTLGGQNTSGTCNPGYLPHRIEDDQVVIDISALVSGAYLFRLETVTGIDQQANLPDDISIRQNGRELTVTMPREGHRMFHIFALNGQLLGSRSEASRTVRIPLEKLIPGSYMLAIEEAGLLTSKMFLVY